MDVNGTVRAVESAVSREVCTRRWLVEAFWLKCDANNVRKW